MFYILWALISANSVKRLNIAYLSYSLPAKGILSRKFSTKTYNFLNQTELPLRLTFSTLSACLHTAAMQCAMFSYRFRNLSKWLVLMQSIVQVLRCCCQFFS